MPATIQMLRQWTTAGEDRRKPAPALRQSRIQRHGFAIAIGGFGLRTLGPQQMSQMELTLDITRIERQGAAIGGDRLGAVAGTPMRLGFAHGRRDRRGTGARMFDHPDRGGRRLASMAAPDL